MLRTLSSFFPNDHLSSQMILPKLHTCRSRWKRLKCKLFSCFLQIPVLIMIAETYVFLPPACSCVSSPLIITADYLWNVFVSAIKWWYFSGFWVSGVMRLGLDSCFSACSFIMNRRKALGLGEICFKIRFNFFMKFHEKNSCHKILNWNGLTHQRNNICF